MGFKITCNSLLSESEIVNSSTYCVDIYLGTLKPIEFLLSAPKLLLQLVFLTYLANTFSDIVELFL